MHDYGNSHSRKFDWRSITCARTYTRDKQNNSTSSTNRWVTTVCSARCCFAIALMLNYSTELILRTFSFSPAAEQKSTNTIAHAYVQIRFRNRVDNAHTHAPPSGAFCSCIVYTTDIILLHFFSARSWLAVFFSFFVFIQKNRIFCCCRCCSIRFFHHRSVCIHFFSARIYVLSCWVCMFYVLITFWRFKGGVIIISISYGVRWISVFMYVPQSWMCICCQFFSNSKWNEQNIRRHTKE